MAESTKAPKAKSKASPIKTAYLILYNLASAAAWGVVLARTVNTVATLGYQFTFFEVGEWTLWVQTMMAMEVFHALFGVVRAPLVTTIMQVASRFLLVWGIIYPYPYLAQFPTYSSMLTAWSIAEVIRYLYYAFAQLGSEPAPLTWLRYNAFHILYPIGIGSECSLVWLATEPASHKDTPLELYALYAVLAIYVPGSYVLFTHMMSQKKKVMRAAKAKNEKATQ